MEPTSISHSAHRPLRVLIVEDSVADADLLVRELERCVADFTWQRVDTLVEVELALASEPDLVLCDIFLPGLDGREIISLTRSRVPDAAIIIVTGELDDRDAAEVLAGGADDYLLKDRLGRLGGAIDRILTSRRHQRRVNIMIDGQNAILKGIAMGKSLAETLESIVRLVEAQSDDMLCSILRVESDRVWHGAAPSLPDEWNRAVDGEPIGPKAGSCGTAAWRGEAVIVTDIATDPLWEDYRDAALAAGLRAGWSQPVFATSREVLGTFALYFHETRGPTIAERQVVDVAVGLASVALEKAHMDASLSDAQQRTRSLFFSNPEAVFQLGADGAVLDANPAGEHMLGTKSSVLKEYTFEHFVAPDDVARAWDAFRTSLAGVSRSLELTALRMDRSEITISAHTIPIKISGNIVGMYVVCEDITEARALQASYRLAAMVLENIAEGMMVFSADFKLVSINPAFEAIIGWKFEEIAGEAPDFLSEDGANSGLARDIRDTLRDKGVWQGEIQWRRKSGERFPALVSFSTVRDDNKKVLHYVCVFTDITASRDYEQRLAFLSRHDVLTQLANRDQFQEQLAAALANARKLGHCVGVVFLDLDNFKSINDSLGLATGDRLLQSVAARLRECVREGDIVARFGGDEFGVVLSDVNGPEDCTAFVHKLMQELSAPFMIDGHELYATCSVGISLHPQDGSSGPVLMSNADIAMYRAKDQGRNTYQFFSSEMNAAALDNLILANSLRTALERQELQLYYQPRYRISTGEMTGVEALLRWMHPDRGMVSPDEFIPIAESIGVIGDIGEWALAEACRQAVAWEGEGRTGLRMAVNLSARQIAEGNLVDRVTAILAETGMKPGMLDLEITESMLMTDTDRAEKCLSDLHALGIQIAVDDFGTGYSSLSYLKRFTIDDLKIDRVFVQDLPGDEDDAAIVRAIVAVAKSLGMHTVAEGVETQAQLDFLKQLECDEVQGFLFSRPVPAKDLPRS